MKKIINWYISFAHSFTGILFAVLLVLFAVEFYFVKTHFELNSDLAALFDGNSESVQELNAVVSRLGSFETLLVVAHSEDPNKNKRFLAKLEKKLDGSPLIKQVEFHRDVTYLEKHALLFLPLPELKKRYKQLQAKIAKQVSDKLSLDNDDAKDKQDRSADSSAALTKEINRMHRTLREKKKQYDITPYFTADGGRFVALKVRPAGSATSIKALIRVMNFVQSKIDELDPKKFGVEVAVGGPLLRKVEEVKSMNKDLITTLLACIILLSLVIIWYFRSFLSLFIVMLPLSAGILSAVALASVIFTRFNIVSAFSFVILYGLGIDFGIHLLSRYGEEKQKGKMPLDAMIHTAQHIIPSLVSGAVTTAAAFLTIYFIDFKGFSDYGMVAVIGILASLVAFLLFFPVLVFILERFRPLSVKPREITILETLYLFLLPRKKVVIAVSILLTLVSVAAFFDIPFEYDLRKLSFDPASGVASHTVVHRYEQLVKQEKTDPFSRGRVSVYLTNSREEAAAVADKLKQMKDDKKDGGRIEAIVSLKKFLPDNQKAKLRIIARMKRLVERKINLLDDKSRKMVEKDIMPILSPEGPLVEQKLPRWIDNSLRELDGSVGKFVLLLLSGNYQDMKNVSDIKETFGTLNINGKQFHMAAPYLLLADINGVIHHDVPLMALYAVIAVVLTLLLMFRSVKAMLSLLIPLLIALIWMFGAVWLLDIKLNLFNLVIVPTMLGTGIDSSIHLYHRFISSGRHIEELPHILKYTGGAVLFSSLTTLVGFLSLLLSSHRGMASIGAIASIGIVSATVVNLIIFPLLLHQSKLRHGKLLSK